MAERRIILGLTEKITILGKEQEKAVVARVDTGATSSSLDRALAKELLLTPMTKLKIVKSASGIKKRPVVSVKIAMNGATLEEEFTIADRSHMTYPVLIGQNILKKGNFLIDPQK